MSHKYVQAFKIRRVFYVTILDFVVKHKVHMSKISFDQPKDITNWMTSRKSHKLP